MPVQSQTRGRARYVVDGSFVCYQIDEHDILKTIEPILMPVGTSRPRDKGVKRSTLVSGDHRSRSHEAECRFGLGGPAEASWSFSTHLGRVSFPV